MSNLARELEQQQQHQQQYKEQQMQDIQKQKRAVKKSWFTPGEKFLSLAFAGLVCIGAVQMLSSQAKIYKANEDIQKVQSSIKDQQKVNSDLKVQVSKLSNYSRISDMAKKMGLQLNENNVKVVQDK
jgi:cell division protein FtsL